MTQLGMIVTTTEHTSIMNMLTFLKLFAFRVIERSLPKNTFFEKKLKESFNLSVREEILTVRGLLDELALIDLKVSQQAEQKWISYRPRIVFNKCKNPDELTLLPALKNTLSHNLMLRADFIGCLFDDPAVSMTFQQRKALNKVSPSAEIAQEITMLADRIIRLWKLPLRDSAGLLINNANKIYNKRCSEHKI